MKISDLYGKLEEVSHKAGMAATKAVSGSTNVTDEQQQRAIQKWQKLDAEEKEIQARPDSHTGKYARQLTNLSRQKIKTAKAGKLNAFGKPLEESATGGATSSGAVATSVNPFGITMRRPSLFGYTVPKKPTKSHKKHKRSK